jgi:hypothetical protein
MPRARPRDIRIIPEYIRNEYCFILFPLEGQELRVIRVDLLDEHFARAVLQGGNVGLMSLQYWRREKTRHEV